MRLIGITGSIACGKSTVSRELLRRGYPVIDGDALSRELTGPGGPAMKAIRSEFGSQYILPDGSLNRREMGRLVFADPMARDRLDRVMAPFLRELVFERIESVKASGEQLCFLDMPLLYEKGYDQYCDTVWCVWLPEDLQLQRLMARDGFTREEALSRMHAVMSSDEKANRSPVIIDNSGTVEDTLIQVSDQLQTELQRTRDVPRRRRPAREPDTRGPEQIQAGLPPSRLTVPSIERTDASRRMPSTRKVSWVMPSWIRITLICLSAILAVSFASQMLMQAYLARRAEEHEAEQKAIDDHYPLMYRTEILKISDEYNLSPSLIAAVILNESSFRPEVESSVGARGLMQLMPDTAEWIAHKLRWENYHFDQLYQPETNIRFGCWYLNYLSSLFNGDPLCVVCAYHAGQGEIASWLANPLYSSNGTTLIQNNLPEGPTKQYAGRVTRDYGIYQKKYFDQDNLAASSGTGSVLR